MGRNTRKTLVTVFVVVFSAGILTVIALMMYYGSEAENDWKVPGGPRIEWENEVYKFGKISQGTPVSCEFKFRNVGDEEVVISKVHKSCGCTQASWPDKPVPPGAYSVIGVTFDAKKAGPFERDVIVHSNAVEKDIKVLTFSGEVIGTDSTSLPDTIPVTLSY